jgi:hypothetical protein
MYCTVCPVLYCTVLYCTVCPVLVLYCTVCPVLCCRLVSLLPALPRVWTPRLAGGPAPQAIHAHETNRRRFSGLSSSVSFEAPAAPQVLGGTLDSRLGVLVTMLVQVLRPGPPRAAMMKMMMMMMMTMMVMMIMMMIMTMVVVMMVMRRPSQS